MARPERTFVRDTNPPVSDQRGDVVLGDDWVVPDAHVEQDVQDRRASRGRLLSWNSSPLTRKIVTFNLIALNILAAGILWLSGSRDSYTTQRMGALVSDAALVAGVIEAGLPAGAPVSLATGDGIDAAATVSALRLRAGTEVFVFDAAGTLIVDRQGAGFGAMIDAAISQPPGPTLITDGLAGLWSSVAGLVRPDAPPPPALADQIAALVAPTVGNGAQLRTDLETAAGRVFAATSPILQNGAVVGVVAAASAGGEIDLMLRAERERMLQMFLIATMVSIGLSLVLASTIVNPLADLAEAVELGRDRDTGRKRPSRIRIPDLTARPDEIGRLSGALRGMVSALYNRIESNEQFAADVAHEIKNPLASLRSAVGTLRMVKREDQRERLLDVIEHDVR
ncbi:MAG: HAMP domain-containing protein, partial [Rhodobacteraceae bacterium]